MEDFAAEIAQSGTAEGIAQMYDQYLNFIVGEPDLFSLGMGKDIYWALNSAQTKDEEIDAIVDRTVSGLFSVVVTMGTSYLSSHYQLYDPSADVQQAQYPSFDHLKEDLLR